MTIFRETAAAKINLSLHVGHRKANGRHDLESLVTFTYPPLADILTAEPAPGFSLALDGPFADDSGPVEDNIVLKAAHMFAKSFAGCVRPLAFRLTKILPCAAGIGGGSADAAAALRLLVQAHGGTPVMALAKQLAPQLGGDVPACLSGMPGLMRGEGERYQPMTGIAPLNALLVNPRTACPTNVVFATHDRMPSPVIPPHPLPAGAGKSSRAFIRWLTEHTCNSLEKPAQTIAPQITGMVAVMRGLPGVEFVRMSGSGATCFALFRSIRTAHRVQKRLLATNPGWWSAATRLRAS